MRSDTLPRNNRYERKQIHQRKTKRRFTPLNYSSYDIYVQSEDAQECMNYPFYQRLLNRGWKPWHHKWWKGYQSWGRKKFLKDDAHQKERAYYKQQLAHYNIDEDVLHTQKKFSDPWYWD